MTACMPLFAYKRISISHNFTKLRSIVIAHSEIMPINAEAGGIMS
jgi:hypothetical protein